MNTKAKHTAGPWRIEAAEGGPYIVGERYVCKVEDFHAPNVAPQYEDIEAELARETGANAALLASAPDLLAALEKAVDMYEAAIPGECIGPDEQEIIDVGRAAIAKAKGEA